MKRNILRYLVFALVIPALTFCTDERDNNMVGDSILFRDSGDDSFVSVSILTETHELVVLKSGKGTSAATARVSTSESALAGYNEENDTDYRMLPEGCFTITPTELKFSKDATNGQTVTVTWDSNAIGALGNEHDYVIPVVVTSGSEGVATSEGNNVIFINPAWAYIGMEAAVAPATRPSALHGTHLYTGSIVTELPIPRDVTVNYEIDYSLIAAYNQQYGTSYLTPPAEYGVSLAASSSLLPAGDTEVPFTVHFDTSPLFRNGELDRIDTDKYLIPVRLTATSNDAVGILTDITYIPVELFGDVMGPWTVIEGEDLCYANDPARDPDAAWIDVYTVDRMFDGNLVTEWISIWESPNTFPMEFVVDMHKSCVFTKFIILDFQNYQGQYRNYEIYTAAEYNGASTQWNLVASGLRDYDWTGIITPYDYPVQAEIPGRYLKFVILNAQYADAGDYIYERGKLVEVYGEGF